MNGQKAPTELRVSKDRRVLTLVWDEAERVELPAEFLRVVSPSAEVQGHSPDQRITVAGKRDVTIADLVPVGHYAIRIVFSDRHDSGLYTWTYLETLGREKNERWSRHLAELESKRLSR